MLDSMPVNKLNVNNLSDYDLVVLTKAKLNDSYAVALKKYVSQYGNLLILPDDNEADELQNLLNNLNIHVQIQLDTSKVFLNKIHFNHPLFKNVFTKKVRNFAYPFVLNHYHLTTKGRWLYKLSDQSIFAQEFKRKGSIFLINTPINSQNTNFEQAASLIVPLFYQIGKARNNLQDLYYISGEKNKWEIKANLKPDETLKLTNKQESFVPYQVNQYKRIVVTTDEMPTQDGIYHIMYKNKKLGSVAYNYNRKENLTKYLKLPDNENVKKIKSVKYFTTQQQTFFKSQSLWQWFLGLALLFLLIEMLLIRYWK